MTPEQREELRLAAVAAIKASDLHRFMVAFGKTQTTLPQWLRDAINGANVSRLLADARLTYLLSKTNEEKAV